LESGPSLLGAQDVTNSPTSATKKSRRVMCTYMWSEEALRVGHLTGGRNCPA
jgi:hypothetical protein